MVAVDSGQLSSCGVHRKRAGIGEKTAAKINKKTQHFEISSRQRMGHQHTIIAKICQWLPAAHS